MNTGDLRLGFILALFFSQRTWSVFYVAYWKPAVADVCCRFGSVCPSVHLFVRLFATRNLRIGSPFFSVFSCINLDIHRVRKVTKLDFRKKILVSQQGAKSLGKDFWGFDKNVIHLYVLFYLNNGLLVFCTNQMSGKNLILE